MMNSRLSIVCLTVPALLLVSAGCDKQVVREGGMPEDRVIRVSTEVGGTTRGHHEKGAPESLKEFDLLVDTFVGGLDPYGVGIDNGYCYANSKFTYDSESGEWIPSEAASKMLWYNSSTEVRVAAMAPCRTEGSYTLGFPGTKQLLNGVGGTVSSAVTFEVQEEQSKDDYSSDLLFYYRKGVTPKDLLVDGKLPIVFQHMLSNLVITFKLGTEFNYSGIPQSDIISDVVVSGTKRNVKFKQGDEFTLSLETYGDASDVKPYNSSWTKASDKIGNCVSEYECILAPQTVVAGQLSLGFKVAGKSYSWTLPEEYVFEGNIIHYLTLRVGKDVVVVDGVSTEKWGEVDGGTIETD